MKPLSGISRVDSRREHSWRVRLGWSNHRPSIEKVFTDRRHGGIGEALTAAKKFRDSCVQREGLTIKGSMGIENLENSKSEKVRDEWRQERIKRRLETIDKLGRTKIYVGTGVEASKKAREFGASKVTCWKIKAGRQDFYTVFNFMPGVDMVWKDRETRKRCDMEQQKKNGKKKIVLGTGKEAAQKAKEIGASASTCQKILYGKQNFFNTCKFIPYFEANGFKRELTQEIIDKINHVVARYVLDSPLDVAAEVMLNYASRDEIPKDEDLFIKNLVIKYQKIVCLEYGGHVHRKKNTISLDVNGDIEY